MSIPMPSATPLLTWPMPSSATGQPDAYPHLQAILTRPIRWERIHHQYDTMMQYATALRLGTADA